MLPSYAATGKIARAPQVAWQTRGSVSTRSWAGASCRSGRRLAWSSPATTLSTQPGVRRMARNVLQPPKETCEEPSRYAGCASPRARSPASASSASALTTATWTRGAPGSRFISPSSRSPTPTGMGSPSTEWLSSATTISPPTRTTPCARAPPTVAVGSRRSTARGWTSMMTSKSAGRAKPRRRCVRAKLRTRPRDARTRPKNAISATPSARAQTNRTKSRKSSTSSTSRTNRRPLRPRCPTRCRSP
mmetsp:Transcript_4119/g.10487  ORF Transcript_4119/g.10487 Transcript_4119/m.10487 type:complete len:247 (+) Transcript_4119:1880-2620(+)